MKAHTIMIIIIIIIIIMIIIIIIKIIIIIMIIHWILGLYLGSRPVIKPQFQALGYSNEILSQYRWTWIWQTRWDQENWSVICKICHIHMTNTWYASDWDQAYRPSYAEIRHTVVRHIQVHLYKNSNGKKSPIWNESASNNTLSSWVLSWI